MVKFFFAIKVSRKNMFFSARNAMRRFSILPSEFFNLEEVERGQTAFRLFGGPIFLCIVLLIFMFAKTSSSEVALHIAIAYNVMGIGWLYFISLSKISADLRRKVVIFLDLIIWSVGFCLASEIYALIIWIPLTVSMGNGLRYGPKYGFISAGVSGVCVAIALALSPFWRGMPLVSVGIFLTVTVVPFYAFLLTKKVAENRYLMEQRAALLEAAINFDALTGVLSRTGFIEILQPMLSNKPISGSIGALLVIDLDGFKAVNDAAGHAVGDEILRAVAAAMRSCLRCSDSIARLGGDEFAVALPCLKSADDAYWIAEKIIHAVAKLTVPQHPQLQIGASIGLCWLPYSEKGTVDGALAEADALMYKSKRAGKGRVNAGPMPATSSD